MPTFDVPDTGTVVVLPFPYAERLAEKVVRRSSFRRLILPRGIAFHGLR